MDATSARPFDRPPARPAARLATVRLLDDETGLNLFVPRFYYVLVFHGSSVSPRLFLVAMPLHKDVSAHFVTISVGFAGFFHVHRILFTSF